MGLLGSSSLTPLTIPIYLKHIDDLVSILRFHSSQLPPSLVSYIFFPISSILQRNAPSIIPDQIFEKVFIVLGYLSESWWWHCEAAVWEQIFMLCSSVLGGIANKGKGKERDDEVKEAAAQCLFVLLKERDDDPLTKSQQANDRLAYFQSYARSPHFVPVLGQTLSATISISESRSLSLQKTSLQILQVLLELYTPDEMFPVVLPGIVSSMSKVALGSKLEKQWAHGEIVAAALHVMQTAIIKSIGDDICIVAGILKHADDLEGLSELLAPSAAEFDEAKSSTQFRVVRTPSWLKGTTSQLHIAINALDLLTRHPSPVALRALIEFSRYVLEATPQTLTQAQPLLLAFILSSSNSTFDSVSCQARSHLLSLLSDENKSHVNLMQILMRLTSEYLLSLPRLIFIQEENKVQHLSCLIRAVCNLTVLDEDSTTTTSSSISAISKGIGKLLGPSSDIEKWGWSLLSVFQFSDVPLTVERNSMKRLMLESDPDSPQVPAFPSLQLKGLDINTLQILEQMFRSLGAAAGETCLYAIEWFFGIGKSGVKRNAVAAMWFACRLLEGVSSVSLASEESVSRLRPKPAKRLEKLARSLARTLSEQWDRGIEDSDVPPSSDAVQGLSDAPLVERKTGLFQLHENLKITQSSPATINENTDQPVNHRVLSLQTLSVCIGILQSRSSSLFIHVLYPVLHSLVSQVSFLSSTAYASLQFMTVMTSYASPANLLLSNFDYALDAISRRLTRRWLDVDATQVLALLVHLVGSDVVEKAGDVVEECFDRLDEFHGYDVLVEGLVSVLVEVTRMLRNDASLEVKIERESEYTVYPRLSDLSSFLEWFRKRKEMPDDETTDYGPAPQRAWSKPELETDEQKVKEEEAMANAANPNAEPLPTSTQTLTQQMITRSLYFLTHDSPVIRARILTLLASSVPNLPSSALMPAIHSAWPFVLNRLSDQETFVVSAAASLIETLSTYNGEFMFRRIWDDVWPKFKILLTKLQVADATSALARRGENGVGTESSYTHSHRLYRSLLNTMAAALEDVRAHERSFWDVLLLFRRFLSRNANPELQQCARRLYTAAVSQNGDMVWFVLTATYTREHPVMSFLYNEKWDIVDNARLILDITSTK